MRARLLMVQGTMSGVGKTTLVAALCRLLAREGLRVAPFKAQNMSLNSAVTPEGFEISRAQAVQAEAAGLEPSPAMNPVLLKPEGWGRLQVVVRGRLWRSLPSREYFRERVRLRPVVLQALEELRRRFDVVVLEGAGGAAELNWFEEDFVNMGLAEAVDAPVLLVGDIERGGIFAQLLGTLELLEGGQRALVRGLVVNKFRGDPALFAAGVAALEQRSGLPVWGVLPYLEDLALPGEDALDIGHLTGAPGAAGRRGGGTGPGGRGAPGPALDVAVLALSRMANADEFEALAREPDVRVRLVDRPARLGYPDLLILPGSKNTAGDLLWLQERGLAGPVRAVAEQGLPVLGICGGFQMLGVAVEDPHGVESPLRAVPGLGLLPVVTRLSARKTTVRVRARIRAAGGVWGLLDGLEAQGYEIHVGTTRPLPAAGRAGGGPWLELVRLPAGERVADGWAEGSVAGTYCHGLLQDDALRGALLEGLWRRRGLTGRPAGPGRAHRPQAGYDRLAEWLRVHLDLRRLYACLGVAP